MSPGVAGWMHVTSLRGLHWVGFLALMSGVAGCDHATKHLAATHLDEPLRVAPGLQLELAHNTDTAFSLLGGVMNADARWLLLTVLSLLATIAVAALAVRHWREASTAQRIAGALVLGGALGNVVDRALRGHVIDFIHVSYWPIFNVADMAIVAGVGLLLLARAPQGAPAAH